MTLEEQIRPHTQYWDCYNDEPLEYNHTGKVLKIIDLFAIGFAFYLSDNYTSRTLDTWDDAVGIRFTTKELLEIYKKTL